VEKIKRLLGGWYLSGFVMLLLVLALVIGASFQEEPRAQKLSAFNIDESAVVHLRITRAGSEVDLLRDASVWVLAQKDGFPADTNRVQTLFVDLVGLTGFEKLSTDAFSGVPATWGVQQLGNGQILKLEIITSGAKADRCLLFGNSQTSSQQGAKDLNKPLAESFDIIRDCNDPSAIFKTKVPFALTADPDFWMRRDIVSIFPEQILGVAQWVKRQKEWSREYIISKNVENGLSSWVVLLPGSGTMSPTNSQAVGVVVSVLESLRVVGVVKKIDAQDDLSAFDQVMIFYTRGGGSVEIMTGEIKGRMVARVSWQASGGLVWNVSPASTQDVDKLVLENREGTGDYLLELPQHVVKYLRTQARQLILDVDPIKK